MLRALALCSLLLEAGAADGAAPGVALDYGPILRAADARSVSVLFRARREDAAADWTASVSYHPSSDPTRVLTSPPLSVGAETDCVAHVVLEGLEPGTRYSYTPLVDGRPALDGEAPQFETLPDLGGRNADFTVAFLSDQHTEDTRATTPLPAFAVAAAARPLFWAQLGDVVPGSIGRGVEARRSAAELQRLWVRNFAPDSLQARFARSVPLNLATISDHEVVNNYSLNWHNGMYAQRADPASNTLHDAVRHYDRSLHAWWSFFGWGPRFADPMGSTARLDFGESVMAAGLTPLAADAAGPLACVADAAAGPFVAGSFVFLVDDATRAVLNRVTGAGTPGSCPTAPDATELRLDAPLPATVRVSAGGRIGLGARYALHALYHSYRPYPFVEFFVLDTTSFRGDPHQLRDRYPQQANRDTDNSGYPWNEGQGRYFIFGDKPHGANATTDAVRSWLGPAQERAFFEALRASPASILVVAAGYPLYGGKFTDSRKYWQGRESGYDFASDAQRILEALEASGRLVLWVHGDGHSPQLVRLRKNVFQLQVGASYLNDPSPARSPTASGTRSPGDHFGGGVLLAGHYPRLDEDAPESDEFVSGLDQFRGFLRLHFHPGQETLRSSELAGLRHGASPFEVEIPAAVDPTVGEAGRRIVGKVARVSFGAEVAHSVVTGYRYSPGRAVITLQDPLLTRDPRELRILLDATPWVEARWFDERGVEWRDMAAVLRREP